MIITLLLYRSRDYYAGVYIDKQFFFSFQNISVDDVIVLVLLFKRAECLDINFVFLNENCLVMTNNYQPKQNTLEI